MRRLMSVMSVLLADVPIGQQCFVDDDKPTIIFILADDISEQNDVASVKKKLSSGLRK